MLEELMNMTPREMTERGLSEELYKILTNYMIVYDEYYETGSRDSAFLKDLVDSLLGISAVLEVYVRDKQIHPSYALEKLNNSKNTIEYTIKYYEKKLEEEQK